MDLRFLNQIPLAEWWNVSERGEGKAISSKWYILIIASLLRLLYEQMHCGIVISCLSELDADQEESFSRRCMVFVAQLFYNQCGNGGGVALSRVV